MKKILLVLIPFLIVLLVIGLLIFKKEKTIKPEGKGGELKVDLSGKKVLMVIAPQDFRDEELAEPKKFLEEKGMVVEIASKEVNEAVGKLGARVQVDKDISEVNVEDYQAIIFIGGPGATVYFNDQTALDLAKSSFERGKIVGAICIAPSILANARILSGKQATAFPSEKENLEAKGAQYTSELVTIDGKIVTAQGPEAAKEFGRAISQLLGL